jgi:SAM-dependent methyltransferase
MRGVYRDISKGEPKTMREDFCGTYALSCEWANLGQDKRAIGIDLDPEPLAYGTAHNLPLLSESARKRVTTFERDVLARPAPKADIICAMNFSYFIFHSRETLRLYFEACRRSLLPGGLLLVDTFGGPSCGKASVDTKRLPGLVYKWEQEDFDPINNRARFHIHFQPKGERMRKRVFTYDWRMWSIPEVRDIMIDAGFKDTAVYWEGTGKNGRGSGKYHRKIRGESCDVWVAYVVGIK